jgi:spore coat polysaccharide biosynthesis protein SpsF (cytidylyltransferase family)
MSVLAIIQARLGSTRLPGKAFMDICGKPMIAHVYDRVLRVAGVSDIVIAVPWSEWADWRHWASLFHYVPYNAIDAAEVPENDVLGRYARVAERRSAGVIIRITGDCPLLSAREAEHVLSLFRSSSDIEYASNISPGYVDGEDVEVFTASALQRAERTATDADDRQHVTPWLRRNCLMATLPAADATLRVKTSVDTLEDLERVRALVAGVTA